ncbi:hypothetical protein [Sinomonas sp.]
MSASTMRCSFNRRRADWEPGLLEALAVERRVETMGHSMDWWALVVKM